jgi:two-component system sporulation sensor kinase B
MKSVHWLMAFRMIAVFTFLFAFNPQASHAASRDIHIREWQVQWIEVDALSDKAPSETGIWREARVDHPLAVIPSGIRGVWVHFTLPPTTDWQRPGMLVDRLYGLDLAVYQGSQLLYESKRNNTFDLNKLLLPLNPYSDPKDMYIRIVTSGDRAGLNSDIRIGDFGQLSDRFITKELPDLLLGTSIAFLSFIMLLCSRYLHRKQRSSWISLCLIALSMGTLIIVYSPLPYIYFSEYGKILLLLFDVSLFVLIPSFNYYIDQVFEGQHALFTKFRKFQAGYSVFCLISLFTYTATGVRYYEVYYLFSTQIMGFLIMLQLLSIIVLSILNAIKGNKNAIILSVGFFLFALSGTIDLTLYYLRNKTYVLFLWKFGVVIMIMTLVIILARRISADYSTLVNYSKELELYNHTLQRTEKMKIISDLAASVAHEVRNPLQVTRGFLQLLADRTDEKSKAYFELATNELDRASDIITDFLTFAKPEIDTISLLDLHEELRKIEAMMSPLAAMHGGILNFNAQKNLFIYGNSSKLKQAFINIIKNSIEAIAMDGVIQLEASTVQGEVIVQITDNGDGMDEAQIAKLGVPFFSTKSKGTGLGLMVTFRIIEVMKGTIEFHSIKTKGTEVIIRFPLVIQDGVLPLEVRA